MKRCEQVRKKSFNEPDASSVVVYNLIVDRQRGSKVFENSPLQNLSKNKNCYLGNMVDVVQTLKILIFELGLEFQNLDSARPLFHNSYFITYWIFALAEIYTDLTATTIAGFSKACFYQLALYCGKCLDYTFCTT